MKVFADIGELGWALYLSAHVRWLNAKGIETEVITDRGCLYENSKITKIPKEFFEIFGRFPADGFGRYGVSDYEIKYYFGNSDRTLDDSLNYICDWSILKKTIYKPYLAKDEPFKNSILIFPRCRESEQHRIRNLPEKFYKEVIDNLCLGFKNSNIITLGDKEAYNISAGYPNYINLIGNTNIQTLIDFITCAKATVGGTSAPPKLALLQGTPSYIIGHQKERVVVDENWSKTPVGFWEIGVDEYNDFKSFACIEDIMRFVKRC